MNLNIIYLVDYLNTCRFIGAPAGQIEASYNRNTGKFNFKRTAVAPSTFYFDLDFSCIDKNPCSYTTHGEIDPKQLTAGWLMGFRKSKYKWENKIPLLPTYTGEGLYDFHGTRYFLLVANDFQNNHGTSIISPFQEDMLADNNILAKISSDCCKDSCCQHIKRTYFGPVNLTKLEIKLMDEYGRILDMNNMVYFPELKMVNRFNASVDVMERVGLPEQQFKLYVFMDENQLKQKIRIELQL